MGELNERVDELKDEVNGLRNDLEDLEDAVDAIAERLEEELVRANKARLSIWTQSGEGKKYLRLKLIWDTFLSLRTVTERDRREYALRVVGAKPEWKSFAVEREGNPFKRLLRTGELKQEFEQIQSDWQRRYKEVISPLPHASYFVKGGARLVKVVEDTWKLVESAVEEGDFVAAAEAMNRPLPNIEYRYDADVPVELPSVRTWLFEHPHADVTWPYVRVVPGD